MTIEQFGNLFTLIFNFMRNNGITIGNIYISIFDFHIWCLIGSVTLSGLLYILRGE